MDLLRMLAEGIFGGGKEQQGKRPPLQPKLEMRKYAQPIDPRYASKESRQAVLDRINAPAQRDFPGRTNYGVPQDNMIDTPLGYISRAQYNSIGPVMQGPLQRTQDPQFQQTPFSEGSDIQGRQNWGLIPMQGSIGVRPIQDSNSIYRLQNADPLSRWH